MEADGRVSAASLPSNQCRSSVLSAMLPAPQKKEPSRLPVWLGALAATIALLVFCYEDTGDVCHIFRVKLQKAIYFLQLLPSTVLQPLCAVLFLCSILDDRGRFDRTSQIHIWTRRHAWVQAWGSFSMAATVKAVCGGVSVINAILWLTALLCAPLSWLLLEYIGVLKLRVLAVAAPRLARFGECAFWAAVLTTLVAGVLYVLGPAQQKDGLLFYLAAGLSILCHAGAFASVIAALLWAAVVASDSESEGSDLHAAACWARRCSLVTALAFATTLTALLGNLVSQVMGVELGLVEAANLLRSIALCVDTMVNSAAAGMLSGLFGPTANDGDGDGTMNLLLVAHTVAERRAAATRQRLLEAMGAGTGAAATIAALVGDKDPSVLVAEATGRFRSISWTTLAAHPDLILASGTLDGAAASTDLYGLSSLCLLAQCDRFFSHSWHDDPRLKWDALERWCNDFEACLERAPQLWLDKVCINQCNIAEDLMCLPIFLAGCQGLLILCGESYTSRLWCVMELYVYVCMRDVEDQAVPEVLPLGEGSALDRVQRCWRNFDAQLCRCFLEADKVRILALIESRNGIAEFNQKVAHIATDIWGELQTVDDDDAFSSI